MHSDLNGNTDVSEIIASFEDKMVGHMWLELAALIYDPCVWKTIEDEAISFTNPLQELKLTT